jgi:hypothetical protein
MIPNECCNVAPEGRTNGTNCLSKKNHCFTLFEVSSILGNAADFSITWLLIYLAKQAALISNDHYYTLNSTAGKEFVHDNNIPFFPSKYFPSKYDDFSFGLSTAFIHT